jgi:tellurite resistance protein
VIIFGTRGVKMSAGTGTFFCPGCASQQSYTHRKVRRFFTLYFIPIIPLDVVGEFVECGNCRATWKPTVLQATAGMVAGRTVAPPPPSIAASQALPAADVRALTFRAMGVMATLDGSIDDLEAGAAHGVMRSLGLDLQTEAVKKQLSDSSDREQFFGRLRAMAPRLSNENKEQIVRCAYQVAMSDGRIGDAERQLLAQIASEVGVSGSWLDSTLGAKVARA